MLKLVDLYLHLSDLEYVEICYIWGMFCYEKWQLSDVSEYGLLIQNIEIVFVF